MAVAIAYLNLADSATITASSSAVLMPPKRLQDPHIARKWRGTLGTGEYVLADLGVSRLLDTVAMFGSNLSGTGSVRVRVSNTDATGAAGEIYDSAIQVGKVDSRYKCFVQLLPNVVSGRYVRVDLSDTTALCIEAGRLFIGRRSQFEVGFSPGWTRGWIDRSRKVEGRGGQTFVDPDNTYRVIEATFDFVTLAERDSFVEEIDRVNGEHDDILFVKDTGSANLGRDSLWGLIDTNAAVVQPYAADIYRKAYRLKERL